MSSQKNPLSTATNKPATFDEKSLETIRKYLDEASKLKKIILKSIVVTTLIKGVQKYEFPDGYIILIDEQVYMELQQKATTIPFRVVTHFLSVPIIRSDETAFKIMREGFFLEGETENVKSDDTVDTAWRYIKNTNYFRD